MMNTCPQCGKPRQGMAFKCPTCDCFYSQLDEILAEQEAEIERRSLKGRWKAIRSAVNPKQALANEVNRLKAETPRKTWITLAVIFMFVFALIVTA